MLSDGRAGVPVTGLSVQLIVAKRVVATLSASSAAMGTSVRLAASVGFAGPDVKDLRVRGSYSEGADRADRLAVEDRTPRPAGVARPPPAAIDASVVEIIGLCRNAA